MIEVPKELQEQWEREYQENLAKGLRPATDEEFQETYEEVMKEIDAEWDEWENSIQDELDEPDPWYEKMTDPDIDPVERRRLWNERYGDQIWLAGPEDLVVEDDIIDDEE